MCWFCNHSNTKQSKQVAYIVRLNRLKLTMPDNNADVHWMHRYRFIFLSFPIQLCIVLLFGALQIGVLWAALASSLSAL